MTEIDTILKGNDNTEGEKLKSPKQIINDIQGSIDLKMNDLKENQPNDQEKINNLENEVNRRFLMAMSPVGDILGERFQRDICYNLDSSVSQIYQSTAFQANPDISHAGIEECVFEGLWHTYSHLFSSAFFQECMQANYTIDSGHLFDALDKVNVCEDYYAFAFGIYIDYYMSNVEGLVKEQDRIYSYKGMKIMLLDCPAQEFAKRIYIMHKDDRPYIKFHEPSEDQKKSMELKKFNQYGLWMSVQKVEGHEELLSKHYLKELGVEKNKYSLFHAIWTPKLYFKEKYKKICIKVSYKMSDEGTSDSLDKIIPLEK